MIIAGFGFRGSALRASLEDALAQVTDHHRPDALATAEDKADHPAFHELAAELGLQVIGIDTAALAAAKTLTRSPASQSARDTGSVAEAAALVAAGTGARLLRPRRISEDRLATCALARREAL